MQYVCWFNLYLFPRVWERESWRENLKGSDGDNKTEEEDTGQGETFFSDGQLLEKRVGELYNWEKDVRRMMGVVCSAFNIVQLFWQVEIGNPGTGSEIDKKKFIHVLFHFHLDSVRKDYTASSLLSFHPFPDILTRLNRKKRGCKMNFLKKKLLLPYQALYFLEFNCTDVIKISVNICWKWSETL